MNAVLSSIGDRLSGARTIGPSLASAMLVVLIAWSLAQFAWKVIAPAPPYDPANGTEDDEGVQTRQAAHNYGLQIARLHLFGSSTAPSARTVQASKAPETRLNLILRGVVASSDEEAFALIANRGAGENVYRIGDSIPGGAILKAVYPDKVILERNARDETLSLPKARISGVNLQQDAAKATSNGTTPAATVASTEKLSRIRKQVLKNPGQLGKLMEAVPAVENGAFVGYRLSPRGNPTLFSELGLQQGDIVTAVNGIQIDRPEKGLSALQNLVKANEVTLSLLRNGTPITIHHSIGQ